jgi:methyl-accepting chemotaxis protein
MVSIRYLLPTFTVIQISAAIGLMGWLSFYNGQKTVNNLSIKLSEGVSKRINSHIKDYLEKTKLVNETIGASIRSGNLNIDNFYELETFFWENTKENNHQTYLYFGNNRGDFLGVQHRKKGQIFAKFKDINTKGLRETYSLDIQGKRIKLTDTLTEYDPRLRPWYKAAAQAGKSAWSPVFLSASDSDLEVTQSTPIYNKTGELRGVLGNDVTLELISEFLATLEISQSGEAFIIERSGEIIASSTSELPFVTRQGKKERLSAKDSSEILIKSTAHELLQKFGNFENIKAIAHLNFNLDGKAQLVQVYPIDGISGIDWLIVVVIPRSDFTQDLNVGIRYSIAIILGTFVLSVAIAIFNSRWLVNPIMRLSYAAQDIEEEKLDPESLGDIAKRTDELGYLARVFQQMAGAIYARSQSLKGEVQQLRTESDRVKKMGLVAKVSQTAYLQQLLEKSKTTRLQALQAQELVLPALLQKVSYFETFTSIELQKLINIGYRKNIFKGELVCQEDTPGEEFYIILEGSVEIYMKKINQYLATLTAGSFFGELSLLQSTPRTATVRALEDTLLFTLSRDGFKKLLMEYKELAERIAEKGTERRTELEQWQLF